LELIDQARTQVRREWLDAVDRLKTQQSARNLLKTQIAAVQMNYQRTAELYRLGQVGSTVFREAQLNLMQVLQLQRQAQVGEKLAEIEIKRLAGRLLQNE
jgi:outer membrane protein TolC